MLLCVGRVFCTFCFFCTLPFVFLLNLFCCALFFCAMTLYFVENFLTKWGYVSMVYLNNQKNLCSTEKNENDCIYLFLYELKEEKIEKDKFMLLLYNIWVIFLSNYNYHPVWFWTPRNWELYHVLAYKEIGWVSRVKSLYQDIVCCESIFALMQATS